MQGAHSRHNSLAYHFVTFKDIAHVARVLLVLCNECKQLLVAFVVSTVGYAVQWVHIHLLLQP